MIRNQAFDPRTVAREIPGLFEAVLPQLTSGVISALNRTSIALACQPIPDSDVDACELQNAMLFEIGFAIGESLISRTIFDWDACVAVATERQRRHFDAKIPAEIPDHDKQVAIRVGTNLAQMLADISEHRRGTTVCAPFIPGYQWISSGNGDFSINACLVEVKCSARNFTAPDYRQIVMYWLLSYVRAIETGELEWEEGILLNPRSGRYVLIRFDDVLRVIGAGRTKADIASLFSALISSRGGV